MKMKKICYLLIISILMALVPETTEVLAANEISIVVNGVKLQLDQAPIQVDGRVMVPARAIFEALGFSIIQSDVVPNEFGAFISNDRLYLSVTVYLGDKIKSKGLHMVVNCREYDDNKNLLQTFSYGIKNEVDPIIMNGRTLLPARAISEACGARVTWDGGTQTVYVDSSNPTFISNWPGAAGTYSIKPYTTTQPVQGYTVNEVIQATPEAITILPEPVQETVTAKQPTEPPIVGSTPGNIVIDPNNIDYSVPMINNLTDNYKSWSIGTCTWYAYCRFKEVHGVELPAMALGNGHTWLEDVEGANTDYLEIIRDLDDIQPYTIAVYKNHQGEGYAGHVVFIEYIERDANGTPTYIYYTDANGANDTNKGQFDYGIDGIVHKLSFDKFKIKAYTYLAGYIRLK